MFIKKKEEKKKIQVPPFSPIFLLSERKTYEPLHGSGPGCFSVQFRSTLYNIYKLSKGKSNWAIVIHTRNVVSIMLSKSPDSCTWFKAATNWLMSCSLNSSDSSLFEDSPREASSLIAVCWATSHAGGGGSCSTVRCPSKRYRLSKRFVNL